jgi:putative transcriptional regulator
MTVEVDLAAPTFLIAVPQLGDPNFQRSVIFILEHGEHGSMGLVINRSSDLSINAFCASQGLKFRGDGSQAVHIGGPVQTDRAFLLHSPGPTGPETESIMEGVRLSYSIETLKQLVDRPPNDVRVYMGYSGWGPGQLASEITEGAWLIGPPAADLVFRVQPNNVWEMSLRRMGIEPAQLMHSGAVH